MVKGAYFLHKKHEKPLKIKMARVMATSSASCVTRTYRSCFSTTSCAVIMSRQSQTNKTNGKKADRISDPLFVEFITKNVTHLNSL